MTSRRARTTAALVTFGLAALGAVSFAPDPTYADPSIDTVQARVDHLYRQAEQASEHYNTARDQVRHAKVRLAALHQDMQRQQALVEDMRRQVAARVVSQYQGQNLSNLKMFLSPKPDEFLASLTTVSQYDDQQHQMMSAFVVQQKQLEMRQQSASRALAQVTRTEQQMAADKKTIDAKAAEAKDLLSRLKDKAAARAAAAAAAAAQAPEPSRASTTPRTPTPAPSVPASGRAAAAVSYAMAQVGKAYVWGAAGPSAFDCSGLTMTAWAQAGVTLPHSSSAQMSYGTPVSESQLQPGDLVFYYSPVSHVGMYIGNGKIVNAENPSVGVVVAPLHLMPYAGAVRPG